MSQFGVSIKIKHLFFDRDKVIRATRSADRRNLSRAGAFIRQTARNSIKSRRHGTTSAPGTPPFDHVGYARSQRNRERKRQGLRPMPKPSGHQRGIRFILFGYEPQNNGVVIGPVLFGGTRGSSTVPQLLEFGGRTTRGLNNRTVRIRPRPFMRPALERELPQLPRRWQSSVRE